MIGSQVGLQHDMMMRGVGTNGSGFAQHPTTSNSTYVRNPDRSFRLHDFREDAQLHQGAWWRGGRGPSTTGSRVQGVAQIHGVRVRVRVRGDARRVLTCEGDSQREGGRGPSATGFRV